MLTGTVITSFYDSLISGDEGGAIGMPEQKRFVNRQRELSQLRHLADRDAPALILIYGRQRVGKTYLLDHAWQGRRVFYFFASNATEEINRT